MDNKELLELAAKAAGIELDKGWLVYLEDDGEAFNPLVRDDHALRLAVKLSIDLLFMPEQELVYADGTPEECRFSDDPYAATRRAIVRAAAEIGRGME
jgi:hypothetical protein